MAEAEMRDSWGWDTPDSAVMVARGQQKEGSGFGSRTLPGTSTNLPCSCPRFSAQESPKARTPRTRVL